jgi:hypothetical protein
MTVMSPICLTNDFGMNIFGKSNNLHNKQINADPQKARGPVIKTLEMKIIILTFCPLIIGILLLTISSLLGIRVEIDKMRGLFLYAQVLFIAIGAVAILLNKESENEMPQWRIIANKWVGRIMSAFALFFVIASIMVSLNLNR